MKINLLSSYLFLIFCVLFVPVFSKAQANHCEVKKSPYRLALDSGKKIYVQQCLTCHQADGLGVSFMNPPLGGSKRVVGDKQTLAGIVIKGLATHEEIDGIKYQNVMPPHPEMKDPEIAYVLTYIRNSFGNKASSVKVSEVKSARARLK